MTWNELEELIKRCLLKGGVSKDSLAAFYEAIGTPRAAEYAATKFWMIKFPEDDDTKLLRRQLIHLRQTGMFDWEKA